LNGNFGKLIDDQIPKEKVKNLVCIEQLLTIMVVKSRGKNSNSKPKKRRSDTSISVNPKEFMAQCVSHIARKIIDAKENINTRTPRGLAEKLLQEGKKHFPSMSMNMINYAIRKMKSGTIEKPKLKKSSLLIGTATCISSLTGDLNDISVASQTDHREHQASDNQQLNSYGDTSSNCSISTTDSSSSSTTTDVSISDFVEKNKAATGRVIGRPKGSSNSEARSLATRIEAATSEAASELKKLHHNKSSKKRLSKGSLKDIIAMAKAKHGVDEDVAILPQTVRKRVKRGSTSGHVGQTSPMTVIEPYLVELILQLSNMRTPITASQGIQLANSLVQNTKYQKLILEWKSKNCHAYKLSMKCGKETEKVSLGLGYWRSFMKRNAHLIRSKKGVKFDNKRAEWCNYLNIKEMYDEIYNNLCLAGHAVEHPEPVWRDESGTIVESEEKAFGVKSKYELINPDWVLFVDECGSNTSQAKDGQVGGQLYLCASDRRPQQRASTKDAHFTVLGFTAADGSPVMCGIIFAAKSMREEWKMGHDPFAEWVGDEDDIRLNCGDGRQYPYGPTCVFKGKEVPCYCTCSESGSINGKILTDMLRYLDNLKIFDRSTGLNPFLLLDGHGSRFELEFLEYINNGETKWHVNIGLPYGTSYWQVGDSTEQNGCFKMALTRLKQKLVTQKNDHNLPYEINKTDVVKLVKDAWAVSFARVNTNKKAVMQRGWGPKALNYNVLLHEEIAPSNPDRNPPASVIRKTNVAADELNLSAGLAGSLIDRIVIEKNKETRGTTAAEMRQKRHETAKRSLENHEKRCSAGLIAAAGKFSLNEDVLAYVRQTKEQEQEKIHQQQLRKKDIYDTLQAKVSAIREKNLPPEKWSVADLNTMLQWYKNNSDTAMPTKKVDKLARYYQICMRGEPTPPILPLLPLPPLPTLQQPTLTTADEGDSQTSDLRLLADELTTHSEHRRVDDQSGSGDSDLLLLAEAMMAHSEHRRVDDQSGLGDSLSLCDEQISGDDAVLSADLTLNEDENISVVDNNELMEV